MKKSLLLALSLASTMLTQAKDVNVTSPNGKIKAIITDNGGALSYSTWLDGKEIFTQTGLQMQLTTKTLGKNAKIAGVKTKKVSNIIKPVVPLKDSSIKNNYTEATLTMKGNFKVEFRVFDNAIAYRYILNEKDSIYVVDETFNLKPAQPMDVHYQGTETWGSSSENPYTNCLLKDWQDDKEMATLPVGLSSTEGDLQLLISETDLRDYPGLYLHGNGSKDCLSGNIVPYYKKWVYDGDRSTEIKELADWGAHTAGKRSFPWRFVTITDSKGMVEQTIPAQLAAPCRTGRHELDTSWTGVVGLVEPEGYLWTRRQLRHRLQHRHI